MAGIAELGVRASVLGLTNFRAGMASMRREAATAHASFGAFGRGVQTSTGTLQGFTFAVQQAGTTMRFLGNQITNLGLRTTLLLSAPFIAASAAVVDTGAKFEEELTKINTLVGVSADQVQRWGEEILEVAPAVGTLPVELVRGLFAVTSAGLRGSAEAIDVTVQAAKLARIGLGDTIEVARALTAAVQTYGEEVLDATRASEIFLSIVREGNFDAGQLAQSLGRVIGIAQALGISFEELGAFIATFTRTGVPVQVAITSLRATLSAMIKPTEQAREELDRLGLEMSDVREAASDVDSKLNQVGLSIEDFREAAEDPEIGLARTLIALTEAYEGNIESIGRVIGSQRGLAAVLALTGGLADDYIKVVDSITNSHGVVAESFETVSQTLTFRWEVLKAQVDVVAQRFATAIIPIVNELIEGLTKLAARIEDFAEANPHLVRIAFVLGAVAAAVGPVLVVTGFLISTWGIAIQFAAQFASLLLSLGSGFTLILAPMLAAAAAFTGLIGLIAVAIPRMKTLLTTTREVTRVINSDMSQGMTEAITATEEVVNDKFGNMVDDLFAWGHNIIISFANGILNGAAAVVRALAQIAAAISYWLSPGSPPRILPDLTDWGTDAFNEYMQGWTLGDYSAFNTISDRIERFLQAMGDNVEGTVLQVRESLVELIDEFRNTGDIAESSFEQFEDALGFSSSRIREYIRDLAALEAANEAVAEAQRELTRIQNQFNQAILPIEQRLSEIDATVAEFRRNLRREELETILESPFATDEIKEFANLELEQLDLQDQQAALESERDEAESAARAQLLLAQAEQDRLRSEVEMHEQVLGFFEKNNSLVKSMNDKIKNLSSTVGDLASSLGDLEFGSGPGLLDSLDSALANAEAAANNFIENALSPLEDAWYNLRDAVDEFAFQLALLFVKLRSGALQNKILIFWEDLKIRFLDVREALLPLAGPMAGLGVAVGKLGDALQPAVDAGREFLEDFIEDLSVKAPDLTAVGDAINDISDAIIVLAAVIDADLPQLIILKGFADVKATALRAYADAWGVLAGALSSIDTGVLTPVAEFFERVNKVSEQEEGEGLGGVLTRIEEQAAEFGTVETLIGHTLKNIGEEFSFLQTLIEPITTAFDNQAKLFLETVAPSVAELQSAWAELSARIEPILQGFVSLMGLVAHAVINFVINQISGTIDFLVRMFVRGFSFVGAAVSAFVSLVILAFAGFIRFFEGLIGFFQGIFTGSLTEVFEGLQDIILGAIHFLAGVFGALVSLIAIPLAAIIGIVIGFFEGVVSWFKRIWRELVGESIVPDIINGIIEWFGKIWGIIEDIAAWVAENILNWENLKENILTAVRTMFATLLETLFPTSLRDLAKSFTDWVSDMVGDDGAIWDFVDGVLDAIQDLWDDFIDLINPEDGMIWDILNTFRTELVDKMGSIAHDLVQGLIDGIGARVGDAITAAANFARNVIEGARAALGEDSPSKEFMDIGEDVVAGFNLGITDNASKAVKTMEAFAMQTLPPVASRLEQSQVRAPLAFSRGGDRNIQVAISFGDVNINNDLDQAGFEYMVERAVLEAIS